jgi:hypothetical protein
MATDYMKCKTEEWELIRLDLIKKLTEMLARDRKDNIQPKLDD